MLLYHKQIGSGQPIVNLHGLFGMSDNWMSVARNLSTNYCFYLVNLRNHGRSVHTENFTYQLMMEDVVELLKTLNLSDVV